MTYTASIVALCATIIYAIYRRQTRSIVSQIPGPKPQSFLLGNLPELLQSQVGEIEFGWQEQFGDVIKLHAPFGEYRLLISDPKAIQYIYQASGYSFPKPGERREIFKHATGRGLLWAAGDDHIRHRKVMQPGFGVPETRAFVSIFNGCAGQITAKWTDTLSNSEGQAAVFDIPWWTSRATLDVVGEAFDYRFGAMDNTDNELSKSYFNLLADAFGSPSDATIFMESVAHYIPAWMLTKLMSSSHRFTRLKETEQVATRVAQSLLLTKEDALAAGAGKRDIMSLLVKANVSENAETRLSEEEIIAQMRTMMIAGHETTANTLSWMLLELARNADMQDKLRAELRAAEAAMRARGDTELSVADLEGISYLTAVVKETLRYHSVSYHIDRVAAQDDVLPLSRPITLLSGVTIHELPIPKGQWLKTSIAAFQRKEDLFGPEPHKFNPDRWLDGSMPKKDTPIGVYANLFTFAGGVQSCIGWRFAVLEVTAFAAELVNNFEFSLTPEAKRIQRSPVMVMVPVVEGEADKGAQLPLQVRLVPRE